MTLPLNVRTAFLVAPIAFHLSTYTHSPQSHCCTASVCKEAFIKDTTDDYSTEQKYLHQQVPR